MSRRRAPQSVLWPLFRRDTREIRERASGIDDRSVIADAPEKQISSEETFAVDLRDHEELQERLVQLADRTAARPRDRPPKAGTGSIKGRPRGFTPHPPQ